MGKTEVKMFQYRLRNLVCGLCGDLNDEKTGDVMSAQKCMMSSPRLAAYSYMVEGQCSGIPDSDKAKYEREAAKCVQKQLVPSDVSDIFHIQNSRSGQREEEHMQHIDQEHAGKICISKEQVKMCNQDGQPTAIFPREIAFFCVNRDEEGRRLQRLPSGETGFLGLVVIPQSSPAPCTNRGTAREEESCSPRYMTCVTLEISKEIQKYRGILNELF